MIHASRLRNWLCVDDISSGQENTEEGLGEDATAGKDTHSTVCLRDTRSHSLQTDGNMIWI